MKKAGVFIALLLVNIVVLLIAFILGDQLADIVLYGLLFYVMISTPIYLYLQLKSIQKMAKK